MKSRIRLKPETLELAHSARNFLQAPRTRRELAEYLGISKQSARNIMDNHENIEVVPSPGRELHYVWKEKEKSSPVPQASIWSGLIR